MAAFKSLMHPLIGSGGSAAGADRVLAMDLHSGQCVGYFDIPVDHVYGDSVILDYLASKRISTGELLPTARYACKIFSPVLGVLNWKFAMCA